MPSYISYSFTGNSSAIEADVYIRIVLILPCVSFMTDYSLINRNVYYCTVLLTINDDYDDDDVVGPRV